MRYLILTTLFFISMDVFASSIGCSKSIRQDEGFSSIERINLYGPNEVGKYTLSIYVSLRPEDMSPIKYINNLDCKIISDGVASCSKPADECVTSRDGTQYCETIYQFRNDKIPPSGPLVDFDPKPINNGSTYIYILGPIDFLNELSTYRNPYMQFHDSASGRERSSCSYIN